MMNDIQKEKIVSAVKSVYASEKLIRENNLSINALKAGIESENRLISENMKTISKEIGDVEEINIRIGLEYYSITKTDMIATIEPLFIDIQTER